MLYVHIPFCKQRCIYCDFYSTILDSETSQKYIDAVCDEILSVKDEKCITPLNSIYIGGGTPSVLTIENLQKLFNCILDKFKLSSHYEFTFEMNPDDVSIELIRFLISKKVNRISLGVQSFNNEQLRFLNRRHNAQSARNAVEIIHNLGINNISIDLIYGLPNQTLEQWKSNLNEALQLPIQHISAYSLMYEEGTPLYRLRDSGKIKETDENTSLQMYEILCSTLKHNGFLHYEISNFCLPTFHSRHNSGYWNNTPYIGIGAGAHSFDGNIRYYNEENIISYTQNPGKPHRIYEELTNIEKINEFIFTKLRTSDGFNIIDFKERFGNDAFLHIQKFTAKHINNKCLQLKDNQLSLTERGFFLSDDIMSDLMIVD